MHQSGNLEDILLDESTRIFRLDATMGKDNYKGSKLTGADDFNMWKIMLRENLLINKQTKYQP